MAEIFREPLKLPADVHFGIRFFPTHCVAVVWVVSQILQTRMAQKLTQLTQGGCVF